MSISPIQTTFMILLYISLFSNTNSYCLAKHINTINHTEITIESYGGIGKFEDELMINESCWVNGFYQCSEQCKCFIDEIPGIFFLIISGLSLTSSIYLLLGFMIYKPLRQKPGEMILILSISSILSSANTFATSLLQFFRLNIIDPNSIECEVIGAVETTINGALYSYSIGFCLYFLDGLQMHLKKTQPMVKIHLCLIFIMLVYASTTFIPDMEPVGMTILGICYTRTTNNWSFVLRELTLCTITLITILFTYIKMRRKILRNDSKNNKTLKSPYEYYMGYFLITFIVFLIIELCFILSIYIAYEGLSNAFAVISIRYMTCISKLILIIVITLFRFYDPFIKHYMVRLFYLLFTCGLKKSNSIMENNHQDNSQDKISTVRRSSSILTISRHIDSENPSTYGSLIYNDTNRNNDENKNNGNKSVVLKDRPDIAALVSNQQASGYFLNKFVHNIRIRVIYTLLAGIVYYNDYNVEDNKQLDDNPSLLNKGPKNKIYDLTSKNLGSNHDQLHNNTTTTTTTITISNLKQHTKDDLYLTTNTKSTNTLVEALLNNNHNEELDELYRTKQCRTYHINEELINNSLPQFAKEMNKLNYKAVDGSLTIYAPWIFKNWLNSDQGYINITRSLDIKRNYERIQIADGANGGKGGQFFFFSYDNKVIIKTITDDELEVILKNLTKFAKHYNENSDSLIAKIYGLFTFKCRNVNTKYNLVVMRNINGYPSKNIERLYDIKGSHYNRDVLKNTSIPIQNLKDKKLTLKDMDFLRYEKKLHFPEDIKSHILNIIKKDVDFLCSLGIMDYSLIIYIINKKHQQHHGQHSQHQQRYHYRTPSSNRSANVSTYRGMSNRPSCGVDTRGEKGRDGSEINGEEGNGENEANGNSLSGGRISIGNQTSRSDLSTKVDKSIVAASESEKNAQDERIKSDRGNKAITSVFNGEDMKENDENSGYNSNKIDEQIIKNPLFSIKSTKEDLYYHIGIIDYLQLYTFKKKVEKMAKQLVKMDLSLDTSSQDPITYAHRFIKFIESICNDDDDDDNGGDGDNGHIGHGNHGGGGDDDG